MLRNKFWEYHSTLKMKRENGVVLEMPNGTYILGGLTSPSTSEFLPKGSDVWETGPIFPAKMRKRVMKSVHDMVRDIRLLERSFNNGLHINVNGGHRISKEEFIIIRVRDILKFNINSKEWSYWYKLKEGRIKGNSMVYDGKLFVTGGCDLNTDRILSSTEIMDLSTGKSWMAGELNIARYGFGMELCTFEGKLRILVFGGVSDKFGNPCDLNSVEMWNDTSNSWHESSTKLQLQKSNFGCLSVPFKFY